MLGITRQIIFKIVILDLLGHGFLLQFCVSESVDPSTVQLSPPCSGEGLSHIRVRRWSPPPQLAEQFSHSVQLPQPPLTKENNLYMSNIQTCKN